MEDRCPICGENRKCVPMQGRECLQCCRIDYVFEHTMRGDSAQHEPEPDVVISIEDDEPISAEWWGSQNPSQTDPSHWVQLNTGLDLLRSQDGSVSLVGWFGGCGNEIPLPAVRTRGDLKQLVKLLGRE